MSNAEADAIDQHLNNDSVEEVEEVAALADSTQPEAIKVDELENTPNQAELSPVAPVR